MRGFVDEKEFCKRRGVVVKKRKVHKNYKNHKKTLQIIKMTHHLWHQALKPQQPNTVGMQHVNPRYAQAHCLWMMLDLIFYLYDSLKHFYQLIVKIVMSIGKNIERAWLDNKKKLISHNDNNRVYAMFRCELIRCIWDVYFSDFWTGKWVKSWDLF